MLVLVLGLLLAAAPTEEVSPARHALAQQLGARENLIHLRASPARAVQGAPMEPAARKVVELAREDLAARLKVSDQAIETSLVQSTNWPDSSLGCPKPGLSYAQMITPGYLIELRADGKTWSYHSDLRRVIACDTAGPAGRFGPGPGPVQPKGPVDK